MTSKPAGRFDEEIRRAEYDVRQSAARFEEALDHLRVKIEDAGKKASELTDAVQHPHETLSPFIDRARGEVSGTAERLFGDIRSAAEKQLSRMDEKPLASWLGVLACGCVFGILLARTQYERDFTAQRERSAS